ncbi:MAG: hypothetical protein A2896_00105 [Candidatus Nealsonbacteria bacterium RIFCSPLOWO2_01_FULL_43_32]|uniref:Peptidyl-tRNA hydrolase n=1 Tax=Candidatus Nealsonbacteria bacterium RIFCSPLOWO2_01_FULL_43_32 TaxID=1801672 RepID=A0A1G2EEM3_9BACT|nr:MAG: hypothetical protein A2896_00105 [Candidatus Nealsonbacteria bacterium RIFCSPLOWO2_01_FULL_43_32]
MLLIVGLGNPGKKYEKTRHNVGSRVVGELKSLNLKDIILVQPTTFMNESGRAVKKITKNYKLKTENLIVVHDDIDLPLGEFKIQKNRGSAGHKGVQSIIDSLGTKDFTRIRIGIKPEQYYRPFRSTEKFVLEKFTKDEEEILKEVIPKVIEEINNFIK